MNKEELKLLIKTLVPSIKKIVRNEVKRIAKPIIEEEVENRVNKILAEQFVKSMGNNKSLTEEFSYQEKKTEDRNKIIEEQRKQFRENALKKLGVNDNPFMKAIYEDVSDSPNSTTFGGQPVYVDSDDAGVDLSRFGM